MFRGRQNEHSVNSLTKESVERLYVVNKIRDLLIENTSKLQNTGVLAVLAFGSAVEGVSNLQSDIDIAVLAQEGDADLSFAEFSGYHDEIQNTLHAVLQQAGLPVQFHGSKKGENNNVIHVTLVFVESKYEVPKWADRGINIWSDEKSS